MSTLVVVVWVASMAAAWCAGRASVGLWRSAFNAHADRALSLAGTDDDGPLADCDCEDCDAERDIARWEREMTHD